MTPELADVYIGLRRQILELQSADAGIVPADAAGAVWRAMMETAYPNGVATLVCVADGTTSLYTSTGGGMIGAGGHPSVVAANHAFREAISSHVGQLAPEPVADLPRPGNVILRALSTTAISLRPPWRTIWATEASSLAGLPRRTRSDHRAAADRRELRRRLM